jgi:hypothetical protein
MLEAVEVATKVVANQAPVSGSGVSAAAMNVFSMNECLARLVSVAHSLFCLARAWLKCSNLFS